MTERTPLPSLARPANQDESAAPALELRSVSAGYGASAVLHDVSISVPRSSVVALLGPNGAGKTTTLRVAAGLLRPTGGTVVIGGKEAGRAAPFRRARQGVCLIPEGRGIFRSLTVRENLELLIPPWRSHLPGGRPPVPPDVRTARPDRKNRDRIRPASADEELRVTRVPAGGKNRHRIGRASIDPAIAAFPMLGERLGQVAGSTVRRAAAAAGTR